MCTKSLTAIAPAGVEGWFRTAHLNSPLSATAAPGPYLRLQKLDSGLRYACRFGCPALQPLFMVLFNGLYMSPFTHSNFFCTQFRKKIYLHLINSFYNYFQTPVRS